MEIQNNNDFKYVLQDTNCVYFGRELTYAEMMDREDVPFKFKAVLSAHIARDTDLNIKMADHLMTISDSTFSYRIYEQLKLTVRVCYKVQKKGFGGKLKEKWMHKSCSLHVFCTEYRSLAAHTDVMIEDFSISKLALMVLSI
ncbi:MAG: hypothetical protein K2O40_05580 [Lachnospiraceae bacterium]|nr:hypothetical protein [Lachnospiraceae bacterium]MDE7183944.1 hypothetical protein [Lachnospiraceae bacterium]